MAKVVKQGIADSSKPQSSILSVVCTLDPSNVPVLPIVGWMSFLGLGFEAPPLWCPWLELESSLDPSEPR